MYSPINSWAKRRKKISEGYILVYVPEHPKSFRGWYYEHRLVVESHLNRVLQTWETVHHINENGADNHIRNLFLCTRPQHDKAHRTKDVDE